MKSFVQILPKYCRLWRIRATYSLICSEPEGNRRKVGHIVDCFKDLPFSTIISGFAVVYTKLLCVCLVWYPETVPVR